MRGRAGRHRYATGMILVAVGANLPGPGGGRPITACRDAVRALAALPGLRLVAVSRWYGSAAVPPSGQPDYVNGVVMLEHGAAGLVTPEAMLAALHRIEDAAGRVRSVANAARSLDLDLLAMDAMVRSASDPILPHPRLQDRLFVLQPLRDVCPDWIDPRDGRSVAALIAALLQKPRQHGSGQHGCATPAQPLIWDIPQG
ncbi:2-amino-4-hydroxy-6-hydroxymethyldihydropteridine diphosphokinase [Lichenicoccus sp.]|uniref:2-amino-4-hydroxy-6- hydroxymethyldihydropteridine diphosphokinase n=1 Tax=Lichenicoccus sp. TaxID=2781899 RepID=UPI003D0EC07D